MPRVERGGSRAGDRSVAWWSFDEGALGRRRARPSAHVRDHRGTTSRQPTGQRARRESRCILADKAYDSNHFRSALDEQSCVPVIPSNRSRAEKVPYDKELYKARSEIECTFGLLKQARRFATRYEKTLRNYSAVVAIGCALLWLRV
jgi:transposase